MGAFFVKIIIIYDFSLVTKTPNVYCFILSIFLIFKLQTLRSYSNWFILTGNKTTIWVWVVGGLLIENVRAIRYLGKFIKACNLHLSRSIIFILAIGLGNLIGTFQSINIGYYFITFATFAFRNIYIKLYNIFLF